MGEALESSQKYYAISTERKFHWSEQDKIKTAVAERAAKFKNLTTVSLYLFHDESNETLEDPGVLFFHASSIFNRSNGLHDMVTRDDLIIMSLDLLSRIGAKSKYGAVVDAMLEGDYGRISIQDKFVVKLPAISTEFFETSVGNEYLVGYHGVNKVRRLIPNFMFTYGYFRCGSPHKVPQTEDFDAVCTSSAETGYLVVEKIQDSIPAIEFLDTCTFEDYHCLLLQVALSLAVAEKEIGFTHNDLHAENVLVQKLDRETRLTYTVNGKVYKINTTFIAVIIDYGLARFESAYGRISGLTPVNSEEYFPKPCAIVDFFCFAAHATYQRNFITAESERDLYQAIMGFDVGKVTDWNKIYFTVFPQIERSFDPVLEYLYFEPREEVPVTHKVFSRQDTMKYFEEKMKGDVPIHNVLQYYEYEISDIDDIDKRLNVTLEQAIGICSRTQDYLYMLQQEIKDGVGLERERYLRRIILAYCHLYEHFLTQMKYSEMDEYKNLLKIFMQNSSLPR